MTIKRRLSISFLLLAMAVAARAQDTNFSVRVPCEMQATAGDSEPRLATLTWLQGTTPLVVAEPLRRGRAIPYDADTRVRMVIGPSATGTLYAVRTNAAAVTNGYAVQWPTIGTNTAGAAWFYTILFDKDGRTYWTGSGDLYITATTSTASNGLEWIEYTIPSVGWGDIAGDPADNSALVAYVAEHSGGSAEDTVARAGVTSNLASIVRVGAAATNAQVVASNAVAIAQDVAADRVRTNESRHVTHTGILELKDTHLVVWNNSNAEVQIRVVDDLTGENSNTCAFVGFENDLGFGVLSFRQEGAAGKFVMSEGVPDGGSTFSGPLTLKTLRANLEPDWITLGGVMRTNWPEGSDGISADTATNIAQTVLAASTNAHDGTARASIVAVGLVASNATTAAQAGQIVTGALMSAFRNSSNAVVGGTAVTLWPAVNWVWFLDTGAASVLTWDIPVTERKPNQAVIIALEVFRRESNTWFWPGGLTNAPPTVGETNLFLLYLPAGSTNWMLY